MDCLSLLTKPTLNMRFTSILMAASLTLLSACQSSKIQPETYLRPETVVTGFDFTRYTNQGFMFTPEEYNGTYQSIGMVRVELWPEAQRTEIMESTGETDYGPWEEEPGRVQSAIDSLYNVATDMGADAVVRFNAQRISEEVITGPPAVGGARAETYVRSGVEVSGFAIDRTDAP